MNSKSPRITSVDELLRRYSAGERTFAWAELSGAQMEGVSLRDIDFRNAKLENVNFQKADLLNACFSGADLSGANLREANLCGAEFSNGVYLDHADLSGAYLLDAVFKSINAFHLNLSDAVLRHTMFLSVSLHGFEGLEAVDHMGPSHVDVETLKHTYGFGGKDCIPRGFLIGCGLSDGEIARAQLYAPDASVIFISYQRDDLPFVQELEGKLRQAGLKPWRDEHSVTAGPLEEQIRRAIEGDRTVLAVLSANSVKSSWVEWELSVALRVESERRRKVICPVALDRSWEGCGWPTELKDAIKRYAVLDFSEWQDSGVFQDQCEKLTRGLLDFYISGH